MQKSLLLEEIRIDGGTQLRADINEDYVGECAAVLQSGGKLPPADVFHDGANYWLADGFHRRHAHAKADLPSMKCEIHIGTLRDAILFVDEFNSSFIAPDVMAAVASAKTVIALAEAVPSARRTTLPTASAGRMTRHPGSAIAFNLMASDAKKRGKRNAEVEGWLEDTH